MSRTTKAALFEITLKRNKTHDSYCNNELSKLHKRHQWEWEWTHSHLKGKVMPLLRNIRLQVRMAGANKKQKKEARSQDVIFTSLTTSLLTKMWMTSKKL